MPNARSRTLVDRYRCRRDEHWRSKGESSYVGFADFFFAAGRLPDLKRLLDRNRISGPFVKAFVLVRNESCFWYLFYWALFFGLLLNSRRHRDCRQTRSVE